MKTAAELAKLYFEYFNSNDLENTLNLLSDDVIHDINEGPTEIGKEKFRAFKNHMDKCYSEQITNMCIMSNGNRAAVEFTCSGVYKSTDTNLPPATGQTYSIPAAAFFECKDGLITRITSYYSLSGWLKAIS
jgi:steroid delta-isomerase-like uncharacterized protein